MKNKIASLAVILCLAGPKPARADLFGGDVVVLTQILAQAIAQLAQLKQILSTGSDTLGLMKDINRGLRDAIQFGNTINPYINPGLYKEWKRLEAAIGGIEKIYGVVIDSPEARVQQDTDQSVAEAITQNNSIYDFTGQIDAIGEQIKRYSLDASPGGAAKVTAESLGVMLHVQNEMLRAQAMGMKLQAQTLALQNRQAKADTKHLMQNSSALSQALKTQKADFSLPRF
jgi:hypothetical protein